MEQVVRKKLGNVVTQCRKLLEESISQQLQGQLGIYTGKKKDKVEIDDESRMTHLSDEDRQYRRDLLDHLEHIKARGFEPKDALDQLIREIAFTHLNRLCAYKMMEARGVYIGGQKFREAVSRGVNSNGFKFYLADHPEDERLFNTGKQDVAYRHFLDWLGGLLSEEIGILFSPSDPANRLYPRQKTLDELIDLFNDEELAGIWEQDETIGWIYQYFTPKRLRDQTRKDNPAPRNSYELAFLNQFFTPRYIVEFLTDNTLGRIWYEMRKGETVLKDRCQYLVRRPTEKFLNAEESPTGESKDACEDLSQEELLKQPVYILHRPKKDPREIRVLDPACGSGHFLLYCFDLLQIIYEEAYDDPDLSAALRRDYPALKDIQREIPGLILKHNLHGIDIDLRATQIAALVLWLRCQRTYQELGLKNRERPEITRSNIVCAEPMPGEADLLKEFTATLQPKVLGQLVEVVFDKMKLAGEAGSLLKIEEEIQEVARKAKFEYVQWKKHKEKEKWFLLPEMVEREQPSIFDFADMTDSEFLDRAEEELVEALRQYTEKASNGKDFRRRLFAEDATRGFSFIDVCRKKFDVVLMNPPFGEVSSNILGYLARSYPTWNKNILCAFLERGYQLSQPKGATAAIYDRTAIVKSTYEDFRRTVLVADNRLYAMADLGWGVLDAYVEVTTSVLHHQPATDKGVFIDCREIDVDEKDSHIEESVGDLFGGVIRNGTICASGASFQNLPNSVVGYDFPCFLRAAFESFPSLEESGLKAHQGFALKAEKHFRVWWEVPPDSKMVINRMFNGAGYSPYITALHNVAISLVEPEDLPSDSSIRKSGIGSHRKMGICFGKRGDFFCTHLLPKGHIFTVEGQSIPVEDKDKAFEAIGLLNTPLVRYSLNKYCGQHKYSGYVNLLPYRRLSNIEKCRDHVASAIESLRKAQSFDEVQSLFSNIPSGNNIADISMIIANGIDSAQKTSVETEALCHKESLKTYEVPKHEQEEIESFGLRQPQIESPIKDADIFSKCKWFSAHSTMSIALGDIFGRWDIRFATGQRRPSQLPDPFDPLPASSPGMLQGLDGLPARPEDVPSDYPIRIDWDGIMVDDPEHEDDIVRRVRDVLEVIWKERAETIEREACEILGFEILRDYFRKPGKGGFWDDHIKRYSKSRRKAPIYWLLQSSKKNYAVWLYYHRLDKDTLFKVIQPNAYLDTKIKLEDGRLDELRRRRVAVGDSRKGAKNIDLEIEKQEDLISELRDFEGKLRKAANLNLVPDINDGVALNIAPLHELVPWKEARKYWEELIEGKYEWSSIGKQLREKGVVK